MAILPAETAYPDSQLSQDYQTTNVGIIARQYFQHIKIA
jgi:hypothetical protein